MRLYSRRAVEATLFSRARLELTWKDKDATNGVVVCEH